MTSEVAFEMSSNSKLNFFSSLVDIGLKPGKTSNLLLSSWNVMSCNVNLSQSMHYISLPLLVTSLWSNINILVQCRLSMDVVLLGIHIFQIIRLDQLKQRMIFS